MPDVRLGLDLPDGLPSWLAAFVAEAQRQTPEEGMKHRKCWSKSIGERGARVRLYEDRPGGPLNRSVYVKGREVRKSLGHRDQELAITQAYELLHSLRTNEQALDQETLTVGMMSQLYQ